MIPVAPGTAGTLCALPLVWLMGNLSQFQYIAVCLICFIIGIWVCGKACCHLSVHDHPSIVWDEFVGMQVTMILVPVTWINLLVGFVLFRLFDILKPWPVKQLDQHIKGGFGVMLDDGVAGIMAALILFLSVKLSLF